MSNKTKITVIGTGYVGVTTAAILANAGYIVYAIDISPDRLQALKEGRSFFFEEGLNPLISNAVESGSLIPTSSYEEAIPQSQFVFSCVGTPDNPDGSSNLSYIFASAKEAAKYIQENAVYIQKSTVPVGTGVEVSKVFEGKNVSYVSNPEFLREGTALADTLFFDRIVVGGDDKKSVEKVLDLYRKVEEVREDVAKLASIQGKISPGTYISTGLNSAELIKVTANAFLALKISFANSIAKLADQTSADILEVMDAVGADPRIGKAFLNAGRGYGGGCFPKDVSGLIDSASKHNVDLEIMKSADKLNKSMPMYIVEKAKVEAGGYKGKKIAVLGLAFKAGTSDTRKSPGIKIANALSSEGAIVSGYDPEANEEAKEDLDKKINLCNSLSEAVDGSSMIFVATDWPEFKDLDLRTLPQTTKVLVDCMNIFKGKDSVQNIKLVGVGR